MTKFVFKMRKEYCYFKLGKGGGLYIRPYKKILKTRLIHLICYVHQVSDTPGKFKILDLIANYEK